MSNIIRAIQTNLQFPKNIADDDLYQAHMLYGLVTLISTVLLILYTYAFISPPSHGNTFKVILTLLIICQIPAIHQLINQKWKNVIFLEIIPLWTAISYGSSISGGLYASATMLYVAPLILSIVLLSNRTTIMLLTMTIIYLLLLMVLEESGIEFTLYKTLLFRFIVLSVLCTTIVIVLIYNKYQLALVEKTNRQLFLEKELARIQSAYSRNLSHDLRTPLTVISTQMHLITKRIARNIPIDDGIAQVNSYVHKLVQIVDDFDQMSQLLGDSISTEEWQLVDLHSIIASSIEFCDSFNSEKKIQFVVEDHTNRATTIWGDANYLQQMFKHLLHNSIEYGKQAGKTSIELFSTDDTLQITISDDGIGISQEHLDKIFHPFYRVSTARTMSMYSGTGVGLTIVERIVQCHKGTICVQSEPGKGSTFEVVLPSKKQRLEN